MRKPATSLNGLNPFSRERRDGIGAAHRYLRHTLLSAQSLVNQFHPGISAKLMSQNGYALLLRLDGNDCFCQLAKNLGSVAGVRPHIEDDILTADELGIES